MTTFEFTKRFGKLREPLLAFALKLTRNLEDAKDLVQETGFKAFNNIDQFKLDTNFKAWLTIIMRNTYISHYRKKKRNNTYPEAADILQNAGVSARNSAESNLSMQELGGMLNQLEEFTRVPFVMYYQGYKYEEISDHLNIPLGTVKSRIFFARKQLRKSIGNRADI